MAAAQLWWLYLLATTSHTIYTGITTHPARRWAQHQGKKAGGAKYLKAHHPQQMLLLLPVGSHATAAKLEALIKQLSRKQKQHLVKQMARQSKKYLRQWDLA